MMPIRFQIRSHSQSIGRVERVLFVLLAWMLCNTAVLGQRNLRKIPDPNPELQQAELIVAPGFEINLFAADPRIAKPIQMNFDPAGRLWVASSEVYPQIEPGKRANDKILILEDTDRDGTADSTTVFADGLLIPTGVVPGDGGAYVANSTELLHLRDTNGDGQADHQRVMLSGFGTEDTHHILHTLRWGPGGMLNMNQSIYIHSHIETPYGVRRMNGSGIWQFRPDTLQLETFSLGLVNPWGHAFDAWGQSFATDGAGGEGINYIFPGFVGMTSPGATRIMRGLNPGKPKLCGLEMIGGSHLPPEWQGNLITNDFRAHRVCRYVIGEREAGYEAQELDELVKTRHQAFRPIDVKLGPDGAIYIADWYNPIIQHGEVDFRDPRRDHTHGRIWRITAKDRPLLPYQNLYQLNGQQLLSLVIGDEPYLRRQARRVLQERGAEALVAAASADWIQHQTERGQLEILWLYQAVDRVHPELLESLLNAEDGRVRAAALRVAYHWADRLEQLPELLAQRVDDPHPRVRMELAHVLRRVPSEQTFAMLLRLAEQPGDKFLTYALQQTADQTQSHWLPALREGRVPIVEHPQGLMFALQAADTAGGVPVLLANRQAWSGDAAATQAVMNLVAARGNAKELNDVFNLALDPAQSVPLRTNLLNALRQAAVSRKLRPDGDLRRLDPLTRATSPAATSLTAAAIRLAGSWNQQSHADAFAGQLQAATTPAPIQSALVDALTAMRQQSMLQRLIGQSELPGHLRCELLAGLIRVNAAAGIEATMNALPSLTANDQPERLATTCLSVRGADTLLLEAFQSAKPKVSADVAKLMLRVVRASGRELGQLEAAIAQAGDLQQQRVWSAAERQQAVAEMQQHGDPRAGEAIYRRQALQCQNCHAIGGAGGQVGPDLASIGASAPADYILDSLLDPSAKIKENYHSLIVLTDEGQLITGVKVQQTDEALVLRDAEDRLRQIPLDAIEDQRDGGSLMPSGLLADLTRKETLDLLRFLSELGKIGPFALPREPWNRQWQVLGPVSAKGPHKHDGASDLTQLTGENANWQPAYSRVDGSLPIGDLPVQRLDGKDVVVIRFQLESTADATQTVRLLGELPLGTRVKVGKLTSVIGQGGGTPTVTLAPGDNQVLLVVPATADGRLRVRPE